MVRALNAHSPVDADLLTRLGIAFTTRPRLAWFDIFVSVREGVVTLRGNVSTAYDQRLLVALTRHVAGVRKVDDKLRINEPLENKDSETKDHNGDKTSVAERSNPFRRLPLVAVSLDDMIVAQAIQSAATN